VTSQPDPAPGGGGPPGPPAAFRIPRSHLLDEWPDALKSLTFPSIVVLPGDPVIIPRGLANSVDESTHDTFGRGTAVLPLHEHQERIVLEIWATTRFQRAAIVAGLQRAFDPAEEMSGIRITLPDYLGQVARFTLEGDARLDDDDSPKRRRRARLTSHRDRLAWRRPRQPCRRRPGERYEDRHGRG